MSEKEEEKGLKFDEGKLRFDLIPADIEKAEAMVLTFGAKKYGDNNWRHLDPERILAAKRRHENARRMGEVFDPETGINHAAHELTNALFLCWMSIQEHGIHRDESAVIDNVSLQAAIKIGEIVEKDQEQTKEITAAINKLRTGK